MRDLEIEVSRMLKVRAKIVPVVTGALGTNHRGSDLNVQLLASHPSATELQKFTLMRTAHITSLGKCWGKLL